MDSSPELPTIVTGILETVLVLASTIPAARNISQRLVRRPRQPVRLETDTETLLLAHPEDDYYYQYGDEDGVATDASMEAFSDKWQRFAIAVLSVAGFEIVLALAIVVTHSEQNHFVVPCWLQVGSWMLLCLQAVAFYTEPSSVERYKLGYYAFGASFLATAAPCTQVAFLRSAGYHTSLNNTTRCLFISQLAMASLRGMVSTLIPRRPNVYYEGQVVDQEHTVSIFTRFTFGWVNELLRYIQSNKGLEIDDLPKLPFASRSRTLHKRLQKVITSRPLWKALIVEHARPLLAQSILSLISSVLSFGPQVALYGILKTLEDRNSLDGIETKTWFWVGGMAAAVILSLATESSLWWIIYSRLWVPIYEGLWALIFAKSMRCKDIKAQKLATEKKEEENDDEDDEGRQEKSRQSIINLAAVDARRVGDFATYNYLIPNCTIRLIIAAAFLVHLLGWPSLLAGLSVSVLVTPANTYLTRRYSTAQSELMKATDRRISAVTEVLHGIRQIKFSALEQQWQGRIADRRREELKLLWRIALYTTCMVSIWILGPLMLSAVSLTVYSLTKGDLTASVAFTALSIFSSIESALAGLPDLFARGMEAKVSAERIDEYMASAEKAPHTSDVNEICFANATIAWPAEAAESEYCESDDRFMLHNLNLWLPPRGLCVIAGKTGSGKSLLLSSILGESDILGGSITIPRAPLWEERLDHKATPKNWIIDSAVAYVAQNPWMENATIRDNILFGLPHMRSRYREVISASGLEKDMEILADADMTEIGANGINLSGGQRWRISFARALYSRAGILVMDDIFSALDAETGRHVYENALIGKLGQNRTRILATHSVSLCLPRTDYLVMLDEGSITHAGPAKGVFSTNLVELIHGLESETTVSPAPQNSPVDEITTDDRSSTRRRSSAGSAISHKPRKFAEDEKREKGSIPMKVYAAYLNKGSGYWLWSLVLIGYALFAALLVGRSWWVSLWTSSNDPSAHPTQSASVLPQAMHHINQKSLTGDSLFYLVVYVGLSVVACMAGTLRYLAMAFASLQASRQMFDELLTTVLRTPLRWLDTVPVGRIINRFTSDMFILDLRLGSDLGNLVYKGLELTGILVAGAMISPMLLILAAIFLATCMMFTGPYLVSMREIKRLESTVKSPAMEHFGSSLTGLTTIRAFAKVQVYINEIYARIDQHAQTALYIWLLNRWLALRMSFSGALFTTFTAALVINMQNMSSALAGFVISFALQYNFAMSIGVRFYGYLGMDMNATERVLEYSALETEDQGGFDPPAAWPTSGRIEVKDLAVSYAPDLPPVLKNLSFAVEHNQRVGVVGRTGAGKSSLTLALFRFLEPRQGQILIDGLDISKMKLQALRSRLAIIPQDPVLFSGTVRSNLDPFHEYSDTELYNALERVHLLSFQDSETLASQSDPLSESGSGSNTIASSSASSTHNSSTFYAPKPQTGFFSSLNSPISEGGLNLSQGERQLLCLARAIVSRPKIMLLDEATSAVDMETDALIQRSIRAEFGRNASSLLVIAHRLSTIVDFDKILVMDAGEAVEFGPPKELLGIENGVFRNLVENSGEREVLEDIICRNC